jgi:hypothetical protein
VSSPLSSLNDLICGFRSSASVHWKYFSLVFGCAGGGIVVVSGPGCSYLLAYGQGGFVSEAFWPANRGAF